MGMSVIQLMVNALSAAAASNMAEHGTLNKHQAVNKRDESRRHAQALCTTLRNVPLLYQ
jgi:hypothetical protein